MSPRVDNFSKRRSYNAVSDFVDANVERGLGTKLAFCDGTRSLSYADLQDKTFRFALAFEPKKLVQTVVP